MKLPILFLFLFLFSACDTSSSEQEVSLSDLLVNCWKHAHEEDPADGVDLYRLCDGTDFPISRFRKSIEIRADGTVTYLVLSPIDAHYTEDGTWTFDSESQILEIIDPNGKLHFSREILQLSESEFQLKEGQ